MTRQEGNSAHIIDCMTLACQEGYRVTFKDGSIVNQESIQIIKLGLWCLLVKQMIRQRGVYSTFDGLYSTSGGIRWHTRKDIWYYTRVI